MTRRALMIAAGLALAQFSGTAALADGVDLSVTGRATVAVGVTDGDARADADAEIEIKGAKVLNNGIEIGAVLEGRYDRQQPDRLFAGGRYSSLLIGGPSGIGPMSSDAYVQGLYAYARGGFGEVIVGRDHGVARTFAVTAPTIFSSNRISDWRTDFSGLNDIHTVNDFSGYSTKISYLPPANVLGGVLGGLQLGVSYAPSLASCGKSLCAPDGRLMIAPDGVLLNDTSRWGDVLEAAMYYQRRLPIGSNGLVVGVGASYVTANEDARIALPLFDDYKSYSVGLNLGFGGITVGGSVKSTNAGLATNDDGYLAFDAGITFRTGEDKGDWGVMLGYGQSEATVVGPSLLNPTYFQDTQVAQAGVTYFLGRGITIGAAAQFIEATRPSSAGGREESATAVIESSIRF